MKKLLCVSFVFLASTLSHQCQAQQAKRHAVIHDTIEVDGVEVFYREAGPSDAPTILLLHGYPTSSHMFRNLIQELAGQYHLIAPDYPGYGRSEQPPIDEFEYSFSGMSKLIEKFLMLKKIERYSLYLMDYGAPIGYRIAIRHPERVQGLIIQNGCAYEDGLLEFWDPIKKYWEQHNVENGKALEGFHQPDGLKWQYTHGTGEREREVSPDNWEIDLRHLNRPGNNAIQLAMFYDYRTNVELYPKFQAFFRKYQPPTLIVYGKNDYIFPAEGAYAYKKDLKNIDFNLYDAGHFALETHGPEIAMKIRAFMKQWKTDSKCVE